MLKTLETLSNLYNDSKLLLDLKDKLQVLPSGVSTTTTRRLGSTISNGIKNH